MTEKLYDTDAYCFSFCANVISCEPTDGGYAVILDRTAFFPEGGGQAGDRGTLNGLCVTDVQARGGDVIHFVPEPLGGLVRGEIDAEERLRRMANHTGEHIFSGIVCARFDCTNVGFHLGDTEMTVDYDKELSADDLRAAEMQANRVIRENRTVTACFPSPEALKTLVYRSKKELNGAVRIVTIDGVDVCACCAPHVRRTGEVGALIVTDRMRWKGGVRVRLRCAADALDEYDLLRRDETELSRLLSAPRGQIAPALRRLSDEYERLRREHGQLLREQALARVREINATEGNVCLFFAYAENDILRAAADAGRDKCGGYFVCLTPDGEGFRYAAAAHGELRARIKAIHAALGGKGGGDDRLAQGRFSADKERIVAYFNGHTEDAK